MNANRHASNRPSAITAADRARMAAHVAREDRKRASAAARQRLARFAVACASVALAVALFYSVAN